MENLSRQREIIAFLCEQFLQSNKIDPETYEKYDVKRGLRNADGTGVMAGLTSICDVVGYEMVDGVKTATHGDLIYRGYSIMDILENCCEEERFGFEEVSWLLLFGSLPNAEQLKIFSELLAACRTLPEGFVEDMLLKSPTPNIMNALSRSIIALYSYDDNPESNDLENLMRQSIEIIARTPTIVTNAYQVKRRHFDRKSMYMHVPKPYQASAETILRTVRSNKQFTPEEARLLDLCLILHAEHGAGNNSTFTTRVVSSAMTDTYSALSAAVGSLKGFRHGGANIKVNEMIEHIKLGVKNWSDDDEVADFLRKILRREAGDGSGLIYGIGHAVYTKSDPRAIELQKGAEQVAREHGMMDEFLLIQAVDRLAPVVFEKEKGGKDVCANVDLYSGFVYKSLGIPPELYTPLFAIARMPGWCAHRIEEATTGGRIIRPAYRFLGGHETYVPLDRR
ncbi:MAG: citrate synthase [Christensenellales bacterium]|jgi:citrate synthase